MGTREVCDLTLAAFRAGKTGKDVIKIFAMTVSRVSVFKVICEFETTGKTTRKTLKRERQKRTPARKKRIREKIRSYIGQDP